MKDRAQVEIGTRNYLQGIDFKRDMSSELGMDTRLVETSLPLLNSLEELDGFEDISSVGVHDAPLGIKKRQLATCP